MIPPRLRTLVLLAAGVCSAAAVAGCAPHTKVGPTTFVTVTVTPTPAASTPSSTTASPTPTTAASSSSSAAVMTALPGHCESVLPLGSVVDAVGHTVPGDTAFVLGLPDPDIGRLSYLNCRYGIDKTKPAAIEIGVSLYRTATKAESRIQPTVDDYTQHGASADETTVDGESATLLTGGTGEGYGPTIVLATGQRTVVVSMPAGTDPTSDVRKDLVALAALAVERTGLG